MRTTLNVLLLAMGLCPANPVHAASPQCDGTTLEIQACMGTKADEASARLAKYLSAAQARIDKDFGSKPELRAAQAAWLRYRDLECGDVYQFWAQGTYRNVASEECVIRLTRQRTYELWQAYLTYQDSTPPLLPEPQ